MAADYPHALPAKESLAGMELVRESQPVPSVGAAWV